MRRQRAYDRQDTLATETCKARGALVDSGGGFGSLGGQAGRGKGSCQTGMLGTCQKWVRSGTYTRALRNLPSFKVLYCRVALQKTCCWLGSAVGRLARKQSVTVRGQVVSNGRQAGYTVVIECWDQEDTDARGSSRVCVASSVADRQTISQNNQPRGCPCDD